MIQEINDSIIEFLTKLMMYLFQLCVRLSLLLKKILIRFYFHCKTILLIVKSWVLIQLGFEDKLKPLVIKKENIFEVPYEMEILGTLIKEYSGISSSRFFKEKIRQPDFSLNNVDFKGFIRESKQILQDLDELKASEINQLRIAITELGQNLKSKNQLNNILLSNINLTKLGDEDLTQWLRMMCSEPCGLIYWNFNSVPENFFIGLANNTFGERIHLNVSFKSADINSILSLLVIKNMEALTLDFSGHNNFNSKSLQSLYDSISADTCQHLSKLTVRLNNDTNSIIKFIQGLAINGSKVQKLIIDLKDAQLEDDKENLTSFFSSVNSIYGKHESSKVTIILSTELEYELEAFNNRSNTQSIIPIASNLFMTQKLPVDEVNKSQGVCFELPGVPISFHQFNASVEKH
ncbi:MAG TPA: hypothetical protein QF353_04750 [Gammaproteobacteria bacterium]|nr:hypothetical protein [Gammaproteobacteria bacterium]